MRAGLFVVAVAMWWATPAKAETLYAVVVGVSQYKAPVKSTTHAGRSVHHVGAALEWVYGAAQQRSSTTQAVISYLVDERIPEPHGSPTPGSILDEMRRVFSQAQEDDIVLFYFTGHGLIEHDTGQWLLGTNSAGRDTPGQNLGLSQVAEVVKKSKASRKLVIIDACRTVESDDDAPVLSLSGFYADSVLPLTIWGDAVLYNAAQINEKAHIDPDTQMGFFTQAFVNALTGRADGINGEARDGVLTLSELQAYVEDTVSNRVREELDDRQTPRLFFSGSVNMRIASLDRLREREPSDTLGYTSFGLTVGNLLDAQRPMDWFQGLDAYQRTDHDSRAPVSSETEKIVLRRFYDSRRADVIGAFGRGWTHAIDGRIDLAKSTPCQIEFVSSIGSRYLFKSQKQCATVAKHVAQNCSGRTLDPVATRTMPLSTLLKTGQELGCLRQIVYRSDEIEGAELTLTPSDFRITLGRKSEYVFSRLGRLVKVFEPRKEYELTLHYQKSGQLSGASSSDDEYRVDYNDSGLIERIQSRRGVFEYQYDARLRLTAVRLGGRVLYGYLYDDANRLVKVNDGTVDASAALLAIEYDQAGNRIGLRTTQHWLRWTRPQVNKLELEAEDLKLNAKRRIKASWEDDQLVLDDDELKWTKRFRLLPCCSLVPRSVVLQTDAGPRRTTYHFDQQQGLLTSASYPNDERLVLNWHAGYGRVESFEQLHGGQLTERTTYSYDDQNRLTRVGDDDGDAFVLVYDTNGQIDEIRKINSPVLNIPESMEVMDFVYSQEGVLERVLLDGEVAFSRETGADSTGLNVDGDVEAIARSVRFRGGVENVFTPMWAFIDNTFRLLEGDAIWNPDARAVHQLQQEVLSDLE